MIGHVEIPTAEGTVREPTAHRRVPVVSLALAGSLVAFVWPVLPFSQAPSGAAMSDPAVVAAPRIDPLPQQATLWSAPIPLPDPNARVVGFGPSVVAVTPGAIWPVSLLRDGQWSKLHGLPPGYALVNGVGVERGDGFSLIGVSGDRSIFFDFGADGRFGGAHTVRDLVAGAVTLFGGRVVVFDTERPVGRIVGERSEPIEAPGKVTDVAASDPWLVVLTEDGVVHATADGGQNWSPLGEGFSGLVSTQPVVAIGESAGVGLHRFEGLRGLVRIDRAPIGPTVSWGSEVAVHDWSSESVWTLTPDGWQRIPLWSRDGFHGSFRTLVSGTDVPTVVGETATGELAVWRGEPELTLPG